tara:strand:+ start:1049 stop:1408 length:360 start_codon:yes stop_codon:yes gene_type:complete
MKTTIFTSNQYKVSATQLEDHFTFIEGVETLNLWDISVSPSGHGHYAIIAEFEVNDLKIEVKTKTSDMMLIDAWKELINDNFESDEDRFYENEDEIVEAMLSAINAEDEIFEKIYWENE